MSVLIIGDSHAGALQRGKELMEAEGRWPTHMNITIRPLGTGSRLRNPFFVDRGDHAEIVNPYYRKLFKRLPVVEETGTSIVYGICAPLHSGRVIRQPDWSRFAPTAVADREAPVSTAMVRRVVLDDQKYVMGLLDILLRAGKKVFVIESPSLFRHHPVLKKTRPEVVMRVDREYRAIIRQELAKRSIPEVSVPSKCFDANGFMLDSFRREKDPHHGNIQFGELMIGEIIKFLEKP